MEKLGFLFFVTLVIIVLIIIASMGNTYGFDPVSMAEIKALLGL